MRLFEITAQFKALEELEDSWEEMPPEVIADTLEGLTGDFEAKAVQVAKYILNVEAEADATAEAAKAMARRSARRRKHAENMRHYLLLQMQIIARTRPINTAELIISRKSNPPAVQVMDESAIPDEYWRQPEPPPKAIDKKAIAKALKNGEAVPGAYIESGERIEIKL